MKRFLRQQIVATLVVIFIVIPGTALCLLFAVVGFGIVKASLTNNQILSEYEQEFQEVVHPSHTALIAFNRKVLNSPGNGDHCFYFVGEVRRFSGDRSTIETFYTNQPVQIAFFENSQLNQNFPYALDRLFDQRIVFPNASQAFYIVYTLETRIDDYNSFDLRCG